MNPGAFEINGTRVAPERFYQVACDPNRSVAVEACAGAGKTWMLVSRMLRALLEGCAPQDILAITFTKKAAGEMRQRLQQWVESFATKTDAELQLELRLRGFQEPASALQLQALRGLHARLLQSGRPVQIRTFHSWFAALLRTAPMGVLSGLGLPTAYQLLEDDKKATALVWRSFQTRVASDAAARADYAAAVASYGRFNAQKALESALAKRTEFVLADAEGVVDRSVAAFAQQFPEFAGFEEPQAALQTKATQRLMQDAASALASQKGVKCQQAASALERALSDNKEAGFAAALLTQKGEPRKLGDAFAGADTVRQAQDYLLRVAEAELQHQAQLHQQRMARLCRILLDEFARLKRERGWIDMGDLEQAALTLLSDAVLSGWVQERLDARVRHLLIDEFQDTNPLQWQALHAWLAGYAGAGRAPSVFMVGDPKQSIYRFRRAEPQVFQAAKAFIREGLGGDLLSCDHTRRNAPRICDTVNAVMGQAQLQQEFEGFRDHSTASVAAGAVLQLPAIAQIARPPQQMRQAWRDSLTEPRIEEEETRKVLECRQAARWLQGYLKQTGLSAREVMVLSRRRERLGLMQAELNALGIAAQQPEKSDLMDFAEVQDLVALLDALVSPGHDLSLARALKSPLFGVSDHDLVQLVVRKKAMQPSQPQARLSWMHMLQTDAALPEALRLAAGQLALWKSWVDALPPHDALSAIYASGDVIARFAAAAPVNQRNAVVANLQALLHTALTLDGGRYTTAYGLVRALNAGGNKAPVRLDTAAVRLLTIHGAKGLEAAVVLLLDTDAAESRPESMGALVDWPGEAAYPQRFVFLASESRPPACAVDALAAEQRARSREELNALYVALTRTQQTLVISSVEPRSAGATSWWTRLAPHAQALELPQAPSAQDAMAQVKTADPLACTALPGTALPGTSEPFTLLTLPVLPDAARWTSPASLQAPDAASVQPHGAVTEDSPESRIGQAMHRLLEVLPLRPGGYGVPVVWPPQRLVAIARTFALDAPQMEQATRMATSIASGQGAWAWDADALLFDSNEVPISRGGRLLRIDRLVQTREGTQWWVLDYKSSAAPQQDAALCAQLGGYRAAIAEAYPDAVVRAAFLTPQGALIELNPV